MSSFYASSRWYWLPLCGLLLVASLRGQPAQLQPILDGLQNQTYLQLKQNNGYELLSLRRGVFPYSIDPERQEIKVDWGRAVKYQKNADDLFVVAEGAENRQAFDDFVVKVWGKLVVGEDETEQPFTVKQVYATWKEDDAKWSSRLVGEQVPTVVMRTSEKRAWRNLSLRNALSHLLVKYAGDERQVCYVQGWNLFSIPAGQLVDRVKQSGEQLLVGDPSLFRPIPTEVEARSQQVEEVQQGEVDPLLLLLALLLGIGMGFGFRWLYERQRAGGRESFEAAYLRAFDRFTERAPAWTGRGGGLDWSKLVRQQAAVRNSPSVFFNQLGDTWRELVAATVPAGDPDLRRIKGQADPQLRAREGVRYLNEKLGLTGRHALAVPAPARQERGSTPPQPSVRQGLDKLVGGKRFDWSVLRRVADDDPARARLEKAALILNGVSDLEGSGADWDRSMAQVVVGQLRQYQVLEEVLRAEQADRGDWSEAAIRAVEAKVPHYQRGAVISRIVADRRALIQRIQEDRVAEARVADLQAQCRTAEAAHEELRGKLQLVWENHERFFQQLRSKTPIDNRNKVRTEDIRWLVEQLIVLAFRMMNLSAHVSTSASSATYRYATAGTVAAPERDPRIQRESVDAHEVPTYLEQLIKFVRYFGLSQLEGVLINGFAIHSDLLTAEVLKIDTLHRYRWVGE